MTLREAAQQALDVMSDISSFERWSEVRDALKGALAQPEPEPETCTWWQDGDSDSGMYQTSCGNYFDITDGTPEDNNMRYCCYCGKKLVQELITEDTDE